MKLTAGKLRYLMTLERLESSLPKVRCIDIAVHLGISRASVCKMLSSLSREGLLEQLPDKLQETAALRLEYPELSLSELAAEFDPPVSKSCLNHRLRKLLELSRDLSE